MMARVDQQSVCDRQLFLELTESPIARQSDCDRASHHDRKKRNRMQSDEIATAWNGNKYR